MGEICGDETCASGQSVQGFYGRRLCQLLRQQSQRPDREQSGKEDISEGCKGGDIGLAGGCAWILLLELLSTFFNVLGTRSPAWVL